MDRKPENGRYHDRRRPHVYGHRQSKNVNSVLFQDQRERQTVMEFRETIRFVPHNFKAAIDPQTGISIASGRVEPGNVGEGYDDCEFIVFLNDTNDTRYKFLIKGYGLPPTDVFFMLNSFSPNFRATIAKVRKLISKDPTLDSNYMALRYIASGIVVASGDKKTRVSACLKPADWPELAAEIPANLPQTARGESVLCQAVPN